MTPPDIDHLVELVAKPEGATFTGEEDYLFASCEWPGGWWRKWVNGSHVFWQVLYVTDDPTLYALVTSGRLKEKWLCQLSEKVGCGNGE